MPIIYRQVQCKSTEPVGYKRTGAVVRVRVRERVVAVPIAQRDFRAIVKRAAEERKRLNALPKP